MKKTIKGISWMAVLRIVTRGLALLKRLILARFLSPAQFGIYGIALLTLGLLEMITETGINVFLIQEKDQFEEYINSAWVVSIVRGGVIALVLVLLTPLIVIFFNAPQAKSLLLLVALVAFIRGFINPSAVKFQKFLEFHKEFAFESFLFFLDAFAAIVICIITRSESGLIWGMVVAAIFEVIISITFIKPRPKLEFHFEKLKKVIDRGKWITGAGIFNYIFQNLDDIVVGKLLGVGSLGIYQQAYSVSTLPVSEIGEVVSKVTFPVFVTMSENKKALLKTFKQTLFIVSLIVIPLGILLFVFAKDIVIFILGTNWIEAVPLIKVLTIFGVIKAISNSFYSLFLALKNQEIVTIVELIGIIALAITIVPLTIKFGIVGAGISTIIAVIFTLPFIFFQVTRLLRDDK